ncbi:uncharacterized protein [Amphiura filiformis]|uniref:uncharacterized protein n=1 Tax=Amphiura filiformis TaxID=82378 RepID=UPI003B219748
MSREQLQGMPDIHAAIHRGQYHDLRLLVSAGENVNQRDSEKRTPLILCTLVEQESWAVGIARLLLEQGAMIGYKDKIDRNALMHACLRRRPQLVRVFLGAVDFDLNHRDRHGNTALFYAASTGHTEIVGELVRTLKRYKLTTDVANKSGMTPLLEACRLGHKLCAKMLTDEGGASEAHKDNIRKFNAQDWSDEYDKTHVDIDVVRDRTYDKPWLLPKNPKQHSKRRQISSEQTRASSESLRAWRGRDESRSLRGTSEITESAHRAGSASSMPINSGRPAPATRLTRSLSDPERKLTQAYKTKLNLINRSWANSDRKSKAIRVNFYPSPAPFSANYHIDEKISRSERMEFKRFRDSEEEWSQEFRQLYRRFEVEVTRSYRTKAVPPPYVPSADPLNNSQVLHHHHRVTGHGHHENGHHGHHHRVTGHGHHENGHHGHHHRVTGHGHHENGHHGHHHRVTGHGHHENGHHGHNNDHHENGHHNVHVDNIDGRVSSRLHRRPSENIKHFPVGGSCGSDTSSDRDSGTSRRRGGEDLAGKMMLKALRRRQSSNALVVSDSGKNLAAEGNTSADSTHVSPRTSQNAKGCANHLARKKSLKDLTHLVEKTTIMEGKAS